MANQNHTSQTEKSAGSQNAINPQNTKEDMDKFMNEQFTR